MIRTSWKSSWVDSKIKGVAEETTPQKSKGKKDLGISAAGVRCLAPFQIVMT